MTQILQSVAIIAAACLVCGTSSAATVSSQLFAGVQHLSGSSAEVLIDNNRNGRLDVGDQLRGVFKIDAVELFGGPTRPLGVPGVNELSRVFDITLAAKVSAPGSFSFRFAPTSSFAVEIGGPAGSMVAFYEDANSEYTRTTGPTCTSSLPGGNCEQNVTDGALFWVAGFSGPAGEFWSATSATDDVAAISAADPGSSASLNFVLGLDLLLNNSGRMFNDIECGFPLVPPSQVALCGSGILVGVGSSSTPYSVFDDTSYVYSLAPFSEIPEPSTITLASFALLGLGASARRRKN